MCKIKAAVRLGAVVVGVVEVVVVALCSNAGSGRVERKPRNLFPSVMAWREVSVPIHRGHFHPFTLQGIKYQVSHHRSYCHPFAIQTAGHEVQSRHHLVW